MNPAASSFRIEDLTQGKHLAADVLDGQAVYTARFLEHAYDFLIHGINNHLFWDCPTRHLVEHYDRHASDNHLDVGVGSGALLQRCRFPSPRPRIALLDLNEDSLRTAARRIRDHADVSLYRADVLQPIPLDRRFDSIAANYLLHCLPGRMEEKAVALGHLRALLAPGGVLFGATILNDDHMRSRLRARFLAARLRSAGVFANEHDTRAGLEHALRAHFNEYSVKLVGCVALFSAKNA